MRIIPVRQTIKDLGVRFPRVSEFTTARWLLMLPAAALAASGMSLGWAMIAFSLHLALQGVTQNVVNGIVTAGETFIVLRIACAVAPYHHRYVRQIAAGTVIHHVHRRALPSARDT